MSPLITNKLTFMIIQQTLLLCFVPEQALLKFATMPDVPHVGAVWYAANPADKFAPYINMLMYMTVTSQI